MKVFRKKKARPDEVRAKPARPDSDSFYSQHVGPAPLDEYSDGRGVRQTHRTSRHSPARRRETNNRTSDWKLAVLLLRAVLVVVLLVGGFFALKLALDLIAEPSDKEKQRWEAAGAVMEQSSAPAAAISAGTPAGPALVFDSARIEQRLGQWELAARLFRSAEALALRGVDEDAIQRLGQALRIVPDNQEAQKLLADIYMRRGRYAEAIPVYIRLLDQNSQQPDLKMNLLKALQESGQTAAGLVLADRILLDQPNNVIVLSLAAAGQIKLGNQEAALALFKRILENEDKNRAAMEGCGKIYFDRNDYQAAVPYYLALTKLDSKPAYYQMLARCYAQQNEAGKSVIFMGQAASLFGGETVSSWFRDPLFDPVRETAEFRSFADRIIGIEGRKAIEAISKRETDKRGEEPGVSDLPKQMDLSPPLLTQPGMKPLPPQKK